MNHLKDLELIKRIHPKLWRNIDDLRRLKGCLKDSAAWSWPKYVLLTHELMIQAITKTMTESKKQLSWQFSEKVPKTIALAAWSYSQKIYRFLPEIQQSILHSKFNNVIPFSSLKRLPNWSVFVEYAINPKELGMTDIGNVYGFFATLGHFTGTNGLKGFGITLLFYTLEDDPIIPIDLIFSNGETVEESLKKAKEIRIDLIRKKYVGQPALLDKLLRKVEERYDLDVYLTRRALSLLLYLCIDEPDFSPEKPLTTLINRPKLPSKKTTFKIPSDPKLIEVGADFSISSIQEKNINSTFSKSMEPHLRSGHWHGYWVGKRDSEERELIYKWLPPVFVNSI